MAVNQWIDGIKIIAIILGWVTILAPVLNIIRLSTRVKGTSSGGGRKMRTWQSTVLMTIGFLGFGIVFWQPVPISLRPNYSMVLSFFGFLLYFGGTGIYLWGLVTLKTMFNVSNYAGAEIYKNHQLITNGPFAHIRHPMYLGVLLAAWGGLFIFRTWTMIVFAPLSFTVLRRAWHEEKILEKEFGEKWQDYVRDVPMWIPRIRKNRSLISDG